MKFSGEQDFKCQLRPKVDGLVIFDQGMSSLFLPHVWEELPDKGNFLRRLKHKAGLHPSHWSGTFKAWRFTTMSLVFSVKAHITINS